MRLVSSFILIGHANPGPWGLIGHLGGTVLLMLVWVHPLCQSVGTWSIQFLTNLYRWVRKVSKCSHTNLWTGFDGSKQNTRARLLVMHAFKTIFIPIITLLIKDSGWELCLNSFGDEMVAISNASRIQNCNFCKASLDKACHVAWSFVNCNAIDVQTHLRGDQRTTLLWFMISYWFFVVL